MSDPLWISDLIYGPEARDLQRQPDYTFWVLADGVEYRGPKGLAAFQEKYG